MSPGESRTTISWRGPLLFVGFVAATLVAFWALLGQRYSPETFVPVPVAPDTLEFVWFGGVLVAAVVALVVLSQQPRSWRTVAPGAAPIALVALLISGKVWLGAPIRTYDMMLFATACGWGVWSWLRNRAAPAGEPASPLLGIIVWSAVVLLAAYQFWEQVGYLHDLALGYADCGENARLMFNTMTNPHELFLRVNPDKPLFYDHVDAGILPFAPLWPLWPDVKLTIVLQIVAVFGAAVPLSIIGKRAFGDQRSASLLVLAWVLYPSTSQFVYSASYGFRWGNMCLLFYFIALACWVTGHRGWALFVAIWAILIKEEAAIVVGMFGLYLAVFERRRVVGLALAAFAFGYFLMATSVLIPAVSGHRYPQARFFHILGATNWQILLSPLMKPRVFWGNVFEPSSLYFGAALLAPLLFLPVRKPSVLFIGAPTFVFCCMNQILKSIAFHYQAGLLPVVFWALVCAVQDWDGRPRRRALASVAGSCVVFSLFLGAQPWSKGTLVVRRHPGRLALVHQFARQIDRRGTLFATQRAAAHFVTQRYLYLDPPVPAGTDYALLDLRDSWRGLTENLDWLWRLRQIQHEVEAIPGLRLAGATDGLLYYSRYSPPLDARSLVERNALPPTAVPAGFDYGSLRILGFTLTPLSRQESGRTDHLRVTTFSTVRTPTNLDVAVRCIVRLSNGPANADAYVSDFQPLGQGIWPIARWETNKVYVDDFVVPLPAGLLRETSSVGFQAVALAPPQEPTD